MYRLLYVCCMLPLIWGLEYVHAQTASVPVTIMLESPSAPETSPPTLEVSDTELSIQQDYWKLFTFRLNSDPGTQVDVSLAVVPSDPSDREAEDLVLDTPSMTFTSRNFHQTQTVKVEPRIHTEVGEDAYTIELSASGVGVTDMKTISVTITAGIRFHPIYDMEFRCREGSTKPVYATLLGSYSPRWGDIEVRASFLPGEDYLVAEPATLIINEINHNRTHVVRVSVKEGAPAGVYWLVLTATREGYDPVEVRGKITIFSCRCSVVLTPVVSNLDFGTWTKPEAGDPPGWVTINADTGARHGSGMNYVSGSTSVGKFKANVNPCIGRGICRVNIIIDPRLRGVSNPENIIRFAVSTMIRGPDDELIQRPTVPLTGFSYPFRADSQGGEYTFQLGGKIGHHNDINHQTPLDTYRGTIYVSVTCIP